MATIFNANTTEGLVITPDTSGEMVFQSNGTTVATLTTSGLDVASGLTGASPVFTGKIEYDNIVEISDSATPSVSVAHTATNNEGIFWHSNANYGIYRTSGAWSSPNYSQLKLKWDTGIILDGGNAYAKSGVKVEGNLWFNSGYGSTAIAYGCRAWVTYNAQTNTILANGNVSSVTDHATGQFTVNFATAMPDVNYAACGIVGQNDSTAGNHMLCEYSPSRTTSSARVVSGTAGNTETDEPYWTYTVFR